MLLGWPWLYHVTPLLCCDADALQHDGQTEQLEWRPEREIGEVSDTEMDDDGMDDVLDLSEMLEDNEALERCVNPEAASVCNTQLSCFGLQGRCTK